MAEEVEDVLADVCAGWRRPATPKASSRVLATLDEHGLRRGRFAACTDASAEVVEMPPPRLTATDPDRRDPGSVSSCPRVHGRWAARSLDRVSAARTQRVAVRTTCPRDRPHVAREFDDGPATGPERSQPAAPSRTRAAQVGIGRHWPRPTTAPFITGGGADKLSELGGGAAGRGRPRPCSR